MMQTTPWGSRKGWNLSKDGGHSHLAAKTAEPSEPRSLRSSGFDPYGAASNKKNSSSFPDMGNRRIGGGSGSTAVISDKPAYYRLFEVLCR